MNYRKIWQDNFGEIPPGHEIHHIDGNRNNNTPSNLKCVTIEEHYRIHFDQEDYGACIIMSDRMRLSIEEKRDLAKKAAENDKRWKGDKNYWYGKSTSSNVKKIWDNRTETEIKRLSEKISKTRKEKGIAVGESNPMYGRSAVTEQNLKWYNDGEKNIYVTEGTQPVNFVRGRITKWSTKKKN